jgi:hypothetical protein
MNVMRLGYYELEWGLNREGVSKLMVCSSLNSFIFYAERYNISTYGGNASYQNFGVFLPKQLENVIELIV